MKCLLCLSPEHIAGKMMLVRWVECGMDLYYRQASGMPLADDTRRFDFSAMVAYQVAHSIDQLDQVDILIIGGGPIERSLEDSLKGRAERIYHTYGMTETLSHIALRQIAPRQEQVFRPLPGISLRTDERGALVIKAPALGVDELVTNDAVELFDDQSFIWKGRLDNVVISGGLKLHPEQIEEDLGDLGVPYFVGGIPDELLGEKLVLLIESETPIRSEFLQQRIDSLPAYHRPKQIFYLSRFERTELGKLRRSRMLRDLV